MNVLITGGAGFICSQLAEKPLKESYEISDGLSSSVIESFSGRKSVLLKYKKRDNKRELSRIKVAFVHNTIAPYRHPLFERLSEVVDLIVYYCSVKDESRKWDVWPTNYNYKYKVLPRIPIRMSIGEFSLNPTVVKEIIKSKPNLVVVGGYTDPTIWLTFIIAKLLKIPIIYWTEGIKEPRSILGIITRPVRMFFVKNSDAVVVPGKMSKNYVISLGITEEKVFVAPNTIDNELFVETSRKYQSYKEELKGQLGLKGKVVILYVGRLIRKKGVIFLLEAYRKLKSEINDIALVIVGYGKLHNTLLKLCQEKKINNVIFIGGIADYKRLIMYYSMADVFVLPTLEDLWGFVINEAMACGLPVISTVKAQAALEMICHGKNGYIVKEANSEELYKAIKKLILDQELRKKMGERSIEVVKHKFNITHMVNGFLTAIKYAIKSA